MRVGTMSEEKSSLGLLVLLYVIWFNSSAACITNAKNALSETYTPFLLTFVEFACTVLIMCVVLYLRNETQLANANPAGSPSESYGETSLGTPSKSAQHESFACLDAAAHEQESAMLLQQHGSAAQHAGTRQYDLYKDKYIMWLGFLNLLIFLCNNFSIGATSVSITEIVKALEPIFAILLVRCVLGEAMTMWVYASVLPIVLGVVFATTQDKGFTVDGLLWALASNFSLVCRNVLSKHMKQAFPQVVAYRDDLLVFQLMHVWSAVMTLGLWAGHDLAAAALGWPASPESVTLATERMPWFACAGAAGMYFAYNFTSYTVLRFVTPVTHAISNCMRRLYIIGATATYFAYAFGAQEVMGFVISSAGVVGYTFARRHADAAAAGAAAAGARSGGGGGGSVAMLGALDRLSAAGGGRV